MSLRAVRFNPRPGDPKLGTEWIPAGLEYRPYHPDLEKDILWDGMDERKFKCSATLQRYLVEFYRETKDLMIDLPPLDDVPSIDVSAAICDIVARFMSPSDGEKLFDFRARVLDQLKVYFGALSAEARAEVSLPTLPAGHQVGPVHLVHGHMLSMRSELIELKVWVSLYTEIHVYIHRRGQYMNELRPRHPYDHYCVATWGSLIQRREAKFGWLRNWDPFHSRPVPRDDDAVGSNIETGDEAPRTSDSDVSGLRMRRHA
ncbi:hypothetical protein B0H16DRAFT_1708038 [Mycena metata]|uniref:Uncharacterized protein n=1 Tax=Mycena metata TaxID=1033252 RepID=A0AAD7KIR8_9AGAR|nr:hypothetical protein B0H16DRAFT_1708038 [Mycena metata]